MSLNEKNSDFSLLKSDVKEPLMDKKVIGTRASPARWFFLLLVCLNSVGSFFCFDNPQALQTIIVNQLDLSNFQFNLLYSVYAFPNTILPFFGGLIIDKVGIRLGISLFSFLLIIGQLVFTIGALKLSFPVMLAGRTIFGFGGESLNVASSAITAKWFMGRELAFAFGATLCVARLGSSLNSFLSPKIEVWTNRLYAPLLVGVFLCIFSWITGLMLNCMDRKADLQEGNSQNSDKSIEKITLKDLKEFKRIYYLLLLNGFFLYGGFNGLNNNLNDLMVERFGFTSNSAGNFIPIIYICAAVIIPIFGIYTDYRGKRAFYMFLSTIIFIADHIIIAFLPDATPGTTNYGMIGPLFGVGIFYATYAAIYWPCFPLVVKEKALGTAFGIVFCLQNLMSTIIPMILGVIHDDTVEYKSGYFWTEITLAGLVGFGAILTAWIYFEDLRTGGRLDRPGTERDKESFIKSKVRSFTNI